MTAAVKPALVGSVATRTPKLIPPTLSYPIPDVELLPKPWRRSPWLKRGVYATGGFNADFGARAFIDDEGTEIHECMWVAVDGHGHEIAVARWGNWHEQMTEPKRSELARKIAVLHGLTDVLDEFDPQAEATVVNDDVDSADELPDHYYQPIAPELRAMFERGELLHPGLHFAPFLSAFGRPVMVTINDDWRLVSAIEVLPYREAIHARQPVGAEDHPSRAHPFTLWLDAVEAKAIKMRPGVHVAPWVDATDARDVSLLVIDRHSRLVTAYHTAQDSREGEGRETLENEAQQRLIDDDPVRLVPLDMDKDPIFKGYDAACERIEDRLLGRKRCLDCKEILGPKDVKEGAQRCEGCTDKVMARRDAAEAE